MTDSHTAPTPASASAVSGPAPAAAPLRQRFGERFGQRLSQRLAPACPAWLPDLVAFLGALLFAGLAALLVGSTLLIGGCGGGVGSEGTGSYASGAISGFGSIIVNGVHFDEGAAQVQDDDGQSLTGSALALGMVVQVTAGPITTAADGSSRATASAVRTDRALVGPASAVSVSAGSLMVLGQRVWISVDTVFDARLLGGLAGVGTGQLLEVYGFYDSRRAAYAATRIAPAAVGSGYRVSGTVAAIDAGKQSFTLGSQTYSYASLGSGAAPAVGAVLRLQLPTAGADAAGRWQLSGQRNSDAAPPDRDGAGLDGRITALLPANRLVVEGITVDASAAQISGSLQLGAEVTVRGTLRAGLLVATQVLASNEQPRSFELKGTLSGLDIVAKRFVLRGTPVSYGSSAVVFDNDSAAKLVGYTGTLKVKGQLSADRTLLEAQHIRFGD